MVDEWEWEGVKVPPEIDQQADSEEGMFELS